VTGGWRIAGPYLEACNCEAICPCRSTGGRPGSRATYQLCQFAIAWTVAEGEMGGNLLSGLNAVMAGYWDEDEPGSPWRVVLYVDAHADDIQAAALADILLGRAGGTPAKNYAGAIGEVLAIRAADIEVVHKRGGEQIRAGDAVLVRARAPFMSEETVACGVPGLDRPGQELIHDVMRLSDPELQFDFHGRCGFATDFDYRSD
jgi:hypothetical protein